MPHPITLVDDGQVRWYADTRNLAQALFSFGYVADIDAGALIEPEIESDGEYEDDDFLADAYAEVCSRVKPLDPPDDDVETETMTYEPARSRYGFAASRGLLSLVWGLEADDAKAAFDRKRAAN